MTTQDPDLKELRNQLERLEREFQSRIETLSFSLDRVEASRVPMPALKVEDLVRSAMEEPRDISFVPCDTLDECLDEPIEGETVARNGTIADGRQGLASTELLRTENVDVPEPQILEKEGKNVHLALAALGPVGAVMEQTYAAYQHYRAQGKAPAFLLTIAGVLALTAGFGYLLQYSFSNLLGPMAKLLLGTLSGGAIIFGGAVLHRRKPTMADFASSVIGLGVIVLYLCAYFSGSYFGLVSPMVNFVFFAAAVALGYALALSFEARVVAVVTLGGGVLGPWFVTHPETIADAYAVLLLFLSAASFHLARRLSWHTLAEVAFVSTVAALESIAMAFTAIHGLLTAVVIVHFYLVFYFLLFDGGRLRGDLLPSTAVMLVAEVAFLIAMCVQTIDNSEVRGIVLLVNAGIIGFPFFTASSVMSRARPLFLLCAGGLLGFGLLSLVAEGYLGMLLGAEAVALVYVGVRYSFPSVCYEGLVILGLAGAEILLNAMDWVFAAGWSFSVVWVSILAMVGFLEITAQLLNARTLEETGIWSFAHWAREVEAGFAALAWVGVVCMFEPSWIGILSVVPLFGFLYFASRHGLVVTQWLAFAHIGFLLIEMALSAIKVGNFHFTEQPFLAQAVRIEFFGVLWLLQAFYEYFNIQSIFTPWSHSLRQLFYVVSVRKDHFLETRRYLSLLLSLPC